MTAVFLSNALCLTVPQLVTMSESLSQMGILSTASWPLTFIQVSDQRPNAGLTSSHGYCQSFWS